MNRSPRSVRHVALCAAVLCSALTLAASSRYAQVNLTSDVPNTAPVTDSHLVGAWGIAASATGPWWVNSTFGNVSVVYDGDGNPFPNATPLVVNVPPPAGMTVPSDPTGLVSYAGTGFNVGPNQPARFIFVTRTGTISGWNPAVDRANAIVKVDHAGQADYTGAALGRRGETEVLLVANFKAGVVEAYDEAFQPVALPAGAFLDERVPDNFVPFNVQAIDDQIFVTYAAKDAISATGGGPGQGYVSVFNSEGRLRYRLRHGKWMNSPWAVVRAPDDFGKFSGDILVGMFGDGSIAAFNPRNGNFRGILRGTRENPLTLGKGLWGLGFGNGATAGPANHLFFGADIIVDGKIHGLFGAIAPVEKNDRDNDDEDRNEDMGDDGGEDDNDHGGPGRG